MADRSVERNTRGGGRASGVLHVSRGNSRLGGKMPGVLRRGVGQRVGRWRRDGDQGAAISPSSCATAWRQPSKTRGPFCPSPKLAERTKRRCASEAGRSKCYRLLPAIRRRNTCIRARARGRADARTRPRYDSPSPQPAEASWDRRIIRRLSGECDPLFLAAPLVAGATLRVCCPPLDQLRTNKLACGQGRQRRPARGRPGPWPRVRARPVRRRRQRRPRRQGRAEPCRSPHRRA